ncbi:glycoside hydrolase family 9 protein [Tellurirhabdus rosea]|uniref:glycoside hydrolase family 9 protein n=1 Tax=Tellurirhabdus rosea TaxID=2674997 RepID=UPI00224C7C10|nr:glycoside hydrolase family 9 protein [Tellurirhabdus rosea]
MLNKLVTSSALLLAGVSTVLAQTGPEAIRLNQLGFYPQAPKTAAVAADAPTAFAVVSGKDTVFRGQLSAPRTSPYSGKKTRLADFSAVRKPGKYVLVVPGVGVSYPFEIRNNVNEPVAKASLKGFYFQRLSMPLDEKYAGKWARPAGHPDTKVLVHPSAASASRPAGTVLSSPLGWYDAGDYNKYIVNSGITVATLLSLHEDFPAYSQKLSVGIPESGNAVPDLLDESLYNLRWMLTMQDPTDGGVYHKLTNAKFDGMEMPHKVANTPRYVVQKSTAAALDFAAVMAQASRVYRAYNRPLPGLADSCQRAALRAWEWAQKNPAVLYRQEEMNKQFDPDVTTGAYGDNNLSDEWAWAGAELFATTGKPEYLTAAKLTEGSVSLPSWNQVRALGYYTLLRLGKKLPAQFQNQLPDWQKRVVALSDTLMSGFDQRPYATVMGRTARDFIWGSSAVAANQGIALIQAYRLTRDPRYLRGALTNLDYLLGRNATGYSFVTGLGHKTPMHIHHRPSEADGIAEPVPGLLSGGPNPGRQDKCTTYTSTAADECFTDDACSYASNEIAINWNAPLVYLAGAIEALQGDLGRTAND